MQEGNALAIQGKVYQRWQLRLAENSILSAVVWNNWISVVAVR